MLVGEAGGWHVGEAGVVAMAAAALVDGAPFGGEALALAASPLLLLEL